MQGDLLTREYEASEVWRYLVAIGRAGGPAVRLWATDTRQRFRVDTSTEAGRALDPTPLRFRRGRTDVVLVFGTLPWRHLAVAARARLAGAKVVFFPLGLLTSDFARGSWYLGRGAMWRRAKPFVVRLLALTWMAAAHRVVCASAEEVRQSGFPQARASLAPWPRPDTPLSAAIDAAEGSPGDPQGPVALVSRWDPWRKGFDRLAGWVERHAEALPRPAVLLLVPPAGAGGEPVGTATGSERAIRARLDVLVARGLVEWDSQTRGAALAGRLERCRGAVLLSRWDGQPRALREALLLGLPVLTNASSHLSEVIEITSAGAVVDGDDPDDVQRGFDALDGGDAATAGALFGDDHLGSYLVDLFTALHRGDAMPEDSYYRWFARRCP